MDALDKSDIEEAFKGKLWTYTPITSRTCKIGVSVANEAGYSPVPYNMTRDCGERYGEQKAYCNTLNAERGQTEEQSLDIVCSSMAQGKTSAFKSATRDEQETDEDQSENEFDRDEPEDAMDAQPFDAMGAA